MRTSLRIVPALAVALSALAALPVAGRAAAPAPGSPAYLQRDAQNIADAYGRQTGPNGQLQNPHFAPALQAESSEYLLDQLGKQVATPNRLSLTPGEVFPGWNLGNPLRRGWSSRRGLAAPVSWTNRYGALIRGHVFSPLPGARDPYTHRRLKGPFPGVVLTEGSVQGSERMYFWLAEDLAERGYLILTYDVQGQGTSETLPHQGPVDAVPFCNPFAKPSALEQYGCPGVPAQQPSNFVFGTKDALTFFLSSPRHPYRNTAASDVQVNRWNPLWKLFDRSPDRRSVTPGRRTRVAIVGHSLGAFAVSYVSGVDRRVEAVVGLDKLLSSGGASGVADTGVPAFAPKVPGLAVQSEYGFTVAPYVDSGGSSLTPQPRSPSQAPDPMREQDTGFAGYRKAGVDTMLVVPRASTHLEYTDIAYALPASRYGQDTTSYYVQAWLDKYLKHEPGADARLLAPRYRYLEPVAPGAYAPVRLDRAKQLSFYFCSGYDFRSSRTHRRLVDANLGGVGCPRR